MKYIDNLNEYSNLDFIDYSKLKNKTILISGATGLVGRYFVDLIMNLNETKKLNCKVVGLNKDFESIQRHFEKYFNNNFDYIVQDVCDKVEYDGEVDYIIHCASNTSPAQYTSFPIETININFLGTTNLLNLAYQKKSKKFIFVSSFEVYGNVDNKDSISETDYGYIDLLKARTCYPESKRISENLCIAYSEEKKVNTSIVRFSRIFGETMNPASTLSISQFLKCGIEGTDIILKSDGKQKYSFNYVGDAVSAIIKVMLDGEDKEAYNVAAPKFNITLGEFAQYVAKHANKKVVFDIPKEIEAKSFSNTTMTILDSTKLNKLGWKTKYDIEKRINDTIDILKG